MKVLSTDAISEVLQELLFLHDFIQKVIKLKLVSSSRTVEVGTLAFHRKLIIEHDDIGSGKILFPVSKCYKSRTRILEKLLRKMRFILSFY